MNKRGFRHRHADDTFTIKGEYTRNLQYIYSRKYASKSGQVVDLVYFGVDILSEKMVIGFYRENVDITNGVRVNTSSSLPLRKFNAEKINHVLDRLIPPMLDKSNKG